jgi:HK97 family phage major capsid protein
MSYTQEQVAEMLKEIAKAHAETRGSFENRFDEYDKALEDLKRQGDAIETATAMSQFPGGGGKKAELSQGRFAIDVNGKHIPVLAKGDKLAASFPAPSGESAWSVGDFVRGSLGLRISSSVLERGTATVPQHVSAAIIDLIRAKARIVQAGTLTIPIEGKTHLCKITADPVVYEHAEGVTDIQESVPTFSPVVLDPKSLVALLPLSLEIVQDSPNLDAALNVSIASAFAGKLDSLGIATILADAAIPTSAAPGQATSTWAGTLSAVASMLAADQDVPKALICGTGDFIARAGELAADAGSWLGAPKVLADMLDLPTSGMAAGTAILGNFELGFGIAVRQELRLEVVRWAKSTSASHVLVAYMRAAGYVLQSGALYNQVATVA